MRGRSFVDGVGTLRTGLLAGLGLLFVTSAGCGSEDSQRRDDTTDANPDTGGPDTSDTAETDTAEDTAETSGEVVDGGFRSPCLENSECDSGYCVNTELGPLCTRQCQDTCPDDWRCVGVESGSADLVFLCLPRSTRLCLPCSVDYQCTGGGYCLEDAAGQKTCTEPCGEDDACPEGFVCETKESAFDSSQSSKQCVPVTGLCDCTARNAGEERPCDVANALGRCWGSQVCDPESGWSTCSAPAPGAEQCNGQDDDCDGVTDEGVQLPEEQCRSVNDIGTCTGVWRCDGAASWTCEVGPAEAEVCNYLDDDCDGAVDDPWRTEEGLYVADEHCGTCGSSCLGAIPFATQTGCSVVNGRPSCVALACAPGYFTSPESPLACLPITAGSECSPCLADASCANLHEGRCTELDGGRVCTRGCDAERPCDSGFECDGGRCLPISRSCSCLGSQAGNTRICQNANTFGACFGNQTCNPTINPGWSACSAEVPADEICNGRDDDCDFLVDENLVHDPPSCSNTTAAGTCSSPWICRGASGWTCQAAVPSEEICNYLDDDCDGVTDEGFLDATSGTYVQTAHCGACGISCDGALPNATETCGVDASGRARCIVESCDPGFFQQGPLACVSVGLDSCTPCESDAGCQGGRCVALTDGSYCLNPCANDDNCLENQRCQSVDGTRLCVPVTQACRCTGEDTSLLKGCSVTHTAPDGDVTTCLGTQQCTVSGWGACEVVQEVCNLLDDDCDGLTDEDFLVDGRFADDENCGQCGNDCTLLDFSGAAGICNAAASPPRCSLRCDANCADLDSNPLNGCECCDAVPVDFPDPLGRDSNCDGIDGEIANAVFVAKWGSDTNSGAFGAPKLTLQAGIDAALSAGKRDVYVATGIYKETARLALGVGLYGGYAADFRARDTSLFETAILGPDPTPERPAAVIAHNLRDGLNERTVLDGFAVYGAEVRTIGGSSFAISVRDADDSLRISNNRVFAGTGGKGRRGLDGTSGSDAAPGSNGLSAVDIFAAFGVDMHGCVAAALSRAGGTPGSHMCGGTSTAGGAGGTRTCPTYNGVITSGPIEANRGRPGANGAAGGGGAGWDVYHQRFSCEGYDSFGPIEGGDGVDGASGINGASGGGCALPDGVVVGGAWVAGSAQSGGAGTSGGGGGGGGSGAGAYVHDSCAAKGFNYDNMGATGGGGGAGGCGATAGTAGTSGGGAFAMLVTFTTPPLTVPAVRDNAFWGGIGGDGGDGGNAGTGGAGGAGGFGGAAGGGSNPPEPSYPSFKGGKGGKGGNGGHGGGGGGGCGGPSFGIYAFGQGTISLDAWLADNAFPFVGVGGEAGLGGYSLGAPGGSGRPGAASATNF